ncbi:MAG: CDP-alcohol phosphatidyltransferase family protein [Deltaproteobacteria bacterium]|nr:CDP-alcohol phosphatidyltransferase family protein [Deltaproteobacteria bacterium]
MNLPNILTLLRIALIPLFLYYLVKSNFSGALIVFFIGSITDALDGFIARKFDLITDLGKILDPAADKLFLLTSFTAAYFINLLPLWLFAIAIIKDLVIVSGYTVLRFLKNKVEMRPTSAGKSSTAFQMFTILLLLLNGVGIGNKVLLVSIMIMTGFLLFYSMITYVMIGFKIHREGY